MRRIEQNGFFSASDLFTFAVRSKIYTTPFLIYANRTLDPGLFPQNAGNQLSTV